MHFEELTDVYLFNLLKSLTDRQEFIHSDGTDFPIHYPDYSSKKK